MRAKNALKDLSVYENILKLFKQKGKNIPKENVYAFIQQSRRQTLRRTAFFNPLQQMMIQLVPALISDKTLSSRPKLLSSTAYLYSNLNIYSQALMSHIYQVLKDNIKNKIVNDQVKLDSMYRPFVQLNQYRFLAFLKEVRRGLVDKITTQCSLNSLKRLNITPVLFLRKIERIHILIRIILLDKQTKAEEIAPIIDSLQKYFDQGFRLGLTGISEQVTYQNSAAVYQLLKIFKFSPQGQYKQFLQVIFLKLKKQPNHQKSNLIPNYQRRGQSVFEMRFQKSLHFHGYWFERNINIGLSEYDIVIKGRRHKEYLPFQGHNLENIKQGKWQKITKQEQQLYQKMSGLWNIPLQKKFKEDIVVNLNGPYHYTVGDKRELVRSQTIKRELLNIYGYNQYKNVDYRDWQKQINVLDTQQFFEKLTNT